MVYDGFILFLVHTTQDPSSQGDVNDQDNFKNYFLLYM